MSTLLPEKWGLPFTLPSGAILPTTIYPAPMEGVTEGLWLAVMSDFQLIPYWVMPFIRISTGVPGRSALREKIRPFTTKGEPLIVQLMGVNQQRLVETAQRLAEFNILGIDLNCACPMPKILANGAGGKLLLQPSWIRDTLGEIREKLPKHLAVTVKLRCGFSSSDEMPLLLSQVASSQVDAISLHWRTVFELYRSLPSSIRQERVKEARSLLPHTPLFICGDITSITEAQTIAALNVDGVAPARGLVKNPWLVQQLLQATRCQKQEEIPFITEIERFKFLLSIIKPMVLTHPKKCGKILQMVGMMFGRNSQFFRSLISCPTGLEIVTAIEKYLEKQISHP